MKSIGQMIRALIELIGSNELSTIDQSFVRSAAEQSGQGADTSKLSDKQVENVAAIYGRYFQ